MNFLAIATLKNERACLRFPISSRPRRSLNVMFDSARTGIARVGSFCRWAAATTRSATPTSFLSTAVGLRAFLVAMATGYALLRPARVLARPALPRRGGREAALGRRRAPCPSVADPALARG